MEREHKAMGESVLRDTAHLETAYSDPETEMYENALLKARHLVEKWHSEDTEEQ
jgi:hypothetical protein